VSMSIRRFTGDIDLEKLDFATLQRVSAALAVLEEEAKAGKIVFETKLVQWSSKLRKPRADKKPEPLHMRPLQPGPRKVLEFLTKQVKDTWLSVEEISKALEMKANAVRPHLSLLHKRGDVKFKEVPGKGRRSLKLWNIR